MKSVRIETVKDNNDKLTKYRRWSISKTNNLLLDIDMLIFDTYEKNVKLILVKNEIALTYSYS